MARGSRHWGLASVADDEWQTGNQAAKEGSPGCRGGSAGETRRHERVHQMQGLLKEIVTVRAPPTNDLRQYQSLRVRYT